MNNIIIVLHMFFLQKDVISIEKTNKKYRILYDVKGRFVLKPIKEEES